MSDEPGREHLGRLMATWGMLADLSFSDLLLYVPLRQAEAAGTGTGEDGPGASAPDESGFVVLGQMRPTTNQTVFKLDLVGDVVDAGAVPDVAATYRTGAGSGRWVELPDGADGRAEMQTTPVRFHGDVIAVMCRIWSPVAGRGDGELERRYLDLFKRLSTMVADGVFPFSGGDVLAEEAPRVGDGVMVVDAAGQISFSSPNSVSAMHRMGLRGAHVGRSLGELGVETHAVGAALVNRAPVVEEIERRPDVIVRLHAIPLLEEEAVTGALVLVRDVTDLRRRDRMLLSKETTIREIHHRVKNNLQTISSLLRLQARRLDQPEARTALLEAERRVRSIAVVHELLSREAGDQVPFDEIVHSLVRMARDSAFGSRPVTVEVHGAIGQVPGAVATPLAVAVAELLQNAVEHAFVDRNGAAGDGDTSLAAEEPRIELILADLGDRLAVEVRDNGGGLPGDFDFDGTRSLGLAIVRALVRNQLSGSIEMASDHGTTVHLSIPMTERTLQ